MKLAPLLGLGALLLLPAACAPQPANTPRPVFLAQRWTVGVVHMQGDVGIRLPYTNQFITALGAMPNVSVLYLGTREEQSAFENERGPRVKVEPWLGLNGACMSSTYTIYQKSELRSMFGLVTPAPAAGEEPQSACVDRAATQLYQAMVLQGM